MNTIHLEVILDFTIAQKSSFLTLLCLEAQKSTLIF
jgi:hypothetical protein